MHLEPVNVDAPREATDGFRRYRPVSFAFDLRSTSLLHEIDERWDEDIKQQHLANRQDLIDGLIHEFGLMNRNQKIQNFVDLGSTHSVLSVHNELFSQIRSAFVTGGYYAALAGAGALGERLLNELLSKLKPDYATHPATAKLGTKDSTQNWHTAVDVLTRWGVIDRALAKRFTRLHRMRNDAVHFNLRTLNDTGARSEALAAVQLAQEIINELFPALGGPPRFIDQIPGIFYISSDFEATPLFQKLYRPACVLVSVAMEFRDFAEPNMTVWDDTDWGADRGVTTLTDEEFAAAARGEYETAS